MRIKEIANTRHVFQYNFFHLFFRTIFHKKTLFEFIRIPSIPANAIKKINKNALEMYQYKQVLNYFERIFIPILRLYLIF